MWCCRGPRELCGRRGGKKHLFGVDKQKSDSAGDGGEAQGNVKKTPSPPPTFINDTKKDSSMTKMRRIHIFFNLNYVSCLFPYSLNFFLSSHKNLRVDAF